MTMGTLEPIIDPNNNQSKLKPLDNEPGYFNQVIRPMLMPGHDTELIFWLRNMGLIANAPKCPRAGDAVACDRTMEWCPIKSPNCFQWKCRNCAHTQNIRKSSLFNTVHYISFVDAIRTVLGWCKGYDISFMSNHLGVKKHLIRSIYQNLTSVAWNRLRETELIQKIGGPGVIVIIDTYPEGFVDDEPLQRSCNPILCIAETKTIPPKYWFEPIPKVRRTTEPKMRQEVVAHTAKTIRELVVPGSVLVMREQSQFCTKEDLTMLRSLYPICVTINQLKEFDQGERTIGGSLETIWQNAIGFCEEAQRYSYEEVKYFIGSNLWRAKYQSDAFEQLMYTLTDMQFESNKQ